MRGRVPDSDKLLSARILLPWCYVSLAFLGALAVRVVLAPLYAWEMLVREWRPCGRQRVSFFWEKFSESFNGTRKAIENVEGGDYWAPYFLGVIELLAYPVLIATSQWSIIGAWFTLKTVAQYKQWSDRRSTFNRFLIGNALVVILAYWIARRCVLG